MEELIKAITAKVGISADQATKVVEMVRSHLADKLPAPVAGQVEKLLGGEGGDVKKEAVGVLGKVEGLFGKKD